LILLNCTHLTFDYPQTFMKSQKGPCLSDWAKKN
jgi:hypothetical protein